MFNCLLAFIEMVLDAACFCFLLDFQSIELRILAHLSQDAVLLKVFNDAGSTDIFVQLTCEW